MPYLCPICKSSLFLENSNKSYACENKHNFDIAKEGYVNLLPVQAKKSKQPGDNKDMIIARREFLEACYYQPLVEKISELVSENFTNSKDIKVLDVGCGEGYYLNAIFKPLETRHQIENYGLDISKEAIKLAAKKYQGSEFTVASSQNLPFKNNFFDLAIRIFAPSNDNELSRVLKANGVFLSVSPGPRHLWQIKDQIYKETALHKEGKEPLESFSKIKSEQISFKISPDPNQRLSLLDMTPLKWKAKPEAIEKIKNSTEEIEIDFIVSIEQNKKY
jgi:23S rRNA (guanine745-N1)-methyltransferase